MQVLVGEVERHSLKLYELAPPSDIYGHTTTGLATGRESRFSRRMNPLVDYLNVVASKWLAYRRCWPRCCCLEVSAA